MPPRSSRRTASDTLLLVLGLGVAGCGGGTEPKVPTSASLSASTVSLAAIGQTVQLAATITDQNGNAIGSPELVWTSASAAVVTVSSSGLVTATGNGTTVVTVSAGSASAHADVSVAQVPSQVQKVAGDGQTATPGQPVAVPLTVQVNDASGSPVANVAVTFAATAGTLGTMSASTGADGRASTGFVLIATGAQQVTAAVASTSLTTSFTETGVSPFAIEFQFLTTPTPAQMAAFTAARQRWESLIVGDLPNVSSFTAAAGTCGDNSPAIQRPVDDVLILVTLKSIDGAGNVLGGSTPCFIRSTGKLPVLGFMQLDTDDLDQLQTAGLLQAVILHEMGHVLGYGTIWTTLNLLADASLSGGSDPHFTGTQATDAFNAVGGATYAASLKVPVENTGGQGTADSHWRESVFGNELMTGFVDAGVNPLSRVTVGSMGDLGYTVNLADANPYTLAPGLRAFGRGPVIELKNDVLRVPLHEVDDAGRVLRVIPR
jgi:Leishmanolysin/Bacterial Ig-like domain (group 1)/Bacterial Ig-like domain (group 2)